MTISEKVAYLKGLSDGLGIDTEKSKEGKLISVIIDVLEEVGLSIEDLEESTVSLGEGLDAVSDDLAEVEEFLFGGEDDEDDEEEDDFFEAACPNCEETLVIDEGVLEAGSVQCPNCMERFSIGLSGDCDCGCDDEAEEE